MIRSIQAIGSPVMGGAERFFVRFVNALNERGYPSLAVHRARFDLPTFLDPAVPSVGTGMRNGLDFVTANKIGRLIRRHRPEIVQTYLGRATRLTRIPRGSAAAHVARIGGYYARFRAFRHADAWVGISRGICDYLIEHGFPSKRVFHIGNFVELPERPRASRAGERERLGLDPEALTIFALGRFVEEKGFQDLLEAFSRLPRTISARRPQLVIAGDGRMRDELRTQASHLGIADRVHWPGWVFEPAPWFDAADVFVCPSRDEGLGNIIIEAWSHGLPIVSTAAPGPEELITAEENGLLVSRRDPGELAAGIRRVAEMSEAERVALGEAGRAKVLDDHTAERIVGDYLELYEQLTRN
ncbi:MAG: glycosyltransferase [Gemmatimonadetes bacterium]|nr:glycosyltransferase [Gemmatimonadota bacterium]